MDRLLNVEWRVFPRSPREGEVADETDPGPPVDEAVETAVPGGLLLIVPASAWDAWLGGDRSFEEVDVDEGESSDC